MEGLFLVNSVSMHPHLEFLIMEAVLEHPQRTLTEIVHNICTLCPNRTSVCFGKLSLLLEKKQFQSVESLSYFLVSLRRLHCHIIQINKMSQCVYFLLITGFVFVFFIFDDYGLLKD